MSSLTMSTTSKLRLAHEALPERDLGLPGLALTETLEGVGGESDKVARLVDFEFGGVDLAKQLFRETGRQPVPCLPGKRLDDRRQPAHIGGFSHQCHAVALIRSQFIDELRSLPGLLEYQK